MSEPTLRIMLDHGSHPTKDKGDIGLAYAVAALTEQGWRVSLPLSEHAPYDCIAERGGVCRRVQVRYTSPKGDVLNVKLRSSWASKRGNHARRREVGDFDMLAVYSPLCRRCYFVSAAELGSLGRSLTLRLKPTANGQHVGIRLAADYLKAL